MPGLGALIHPGHWSVRTKLLLLALLPLGILLPLFLAALTIWGGDYFNRLLITKVRSDLAVAHGYFERVTENVGTTVHGLAASGRVVRMAAQSPAQLGATLSSLRAGLPESTPLDFLTFYPSGTHQPGLLREFADSKSPLKGRQTRPQTHLVMLDARQLQALDPALAERARTALRPTLNAQPAAERTETRGLVILSACPVFDSQEHFLGVLAGGILLNRNLAFIDRLNNIVYPEGALPFGSVGTATLFLDDVRIATNVRLFEGQRAIGTRVSQEVRDAVLAQGQTWLNRAFVVTSWYVSAYEPLTNPHGERIGMLYVGFLEAPFVLVKQQATLVVIGLFLLTMVLATALAVAWARRIFLPIEHMRATMQAIEAGQTSSRVGNSLPRDELGELASHFDHMLDQLETQARALKEWGQALDDKVAERTAELEHAVQHLRNTQSQLVRSEKLAAIGQLTAGIAHEINNPVAVLQGNLELMRDLLGPQAEQVAPEIRLIGEQVNRIRLIVTKLLQFVRPQDYAGYLEPVRADGLFQDSLVLVGHLLKKGNIAITQELASTRQVMCNRNELQQVLINLLVNAIEAMPGGGLLTLGASDWDENDQPMGIRLFVSDTGPGLSSHLQDTLFQPFSTADKPGGHGLGLWLSQSLVERYGGHISVDSAPDKGCRFDVWLRLEPLE